VVSESVIVFVRSRAVFEAALAEILRRSELFDQGAEGSPALIAEGYTRGLYLGHGGDCVDDMIDDEDVSEADLRDEFEQVLGVRDPYCFWVRYGDVGLLKRFLWLLLARIPAVVDNDFGLRVPGTEILRRLRDVPEWNLTDPYAPVGGIAPHRPIPSSDFEEIAVAYWRHHQNPEFDPWAWDLVNDVGRRRAQAEVNALGLFGVLASSAADEGALAYLGAGPLQDSLALNSLDLVLLARAVRDNPDLARAFRAAYLPRDLPAHEREVLRQIVHAENS